MKVAITGGTGFVGRYVVKELLDRGLEVSVLTTCPENIQQFHWRDKVKIIKVDINVPISKEFLIQLSGIQKLIHLAWTGLPNYNNPIHYEKYLMPQYHFLKSIIEFGICDSTTLLSWFRMYLLCHAPMVLNMVLIPGMVTND